ncbi:multi-sensor hybrid histidine kinase [Plesiocystis pacifica SIR-1]|uniref:histidine kinase n=1 Tax=Plesiocystis pacifica SIR-1 TaxID=391625 RepID=A6G4Y9_9BACT|nr:ATP-binding protein [Plesiocystis pacifica]EDM79081.1 multi-sensor hybrid histidine kinase [Plesiocystis pacifica SIR-1]
MVSAGGRGRGRDPLAAVEDFMVEAAALRDISELCDLAARSLGAVEGVAVMVVLTAAGGDGEPPSWIGLDGLDRDSSLSSGTAGRRSAAPLPAYIAEGLRQPDASAATVALLARRELGLADGPPLAEVASFVLEAGHGQAMRCWLGRVAVSEADGPLDASPVRPARLILRHLLSLAATLHAERQRQDSELMYQALVEQMPAIVYYREFDKPGAPTFMSPQVEDMIGFKAEEFMGSRELFVERLHPEDRQRVLELQAFHDTANLDGFGSIEYRMIHKDGRTVWLHNRGMAKRDADGKPGFLVGLIFDITEQKQLEAHVVHAQKMEAINRIAGGIAHDFNNILAVIIGYGELMADALDGQPQLREDLDAMLEAAERAKTLVGQLLSFSRRQIQQRARLRLRAVLDGMRTMLARVLREDIELRFDYAPELGSVQADRGQLEQVVMNLLVNARDAMPEGGRIEVRARNVTLEDDLNEAWEPIPAGEYVMFTVSDTGVGMDKETRRRLFEPFFTTKEQGTGLGMSTVLGLVRQHEGTLEVDSAAGEGTRVSVYLPRCADALAEAEAEAAREGAVLGGHEQVLLVEDDDQLRTLTIMVLTRLGYVVAAAEDGERALERFASESFDLVLSDVIMPGISGPELVRRLVAEQPKLEWLLMSGYAGDAIDLAEVDPRRVLSKPFSVRELAARLREVLDAKSA